MKENRELYKHIVEVTKGAKSKKVNVEVLLDTELTKGDVAIYLAIVRMSKANAEYTKVTGRDIYKITGIQQPKQSVNIKNLLEKNYISRKKSDNNGLEYKIMGVGTLKLRLDYFNGLHKNVISYVRRLRYIALTQGQDALPTYWHLNNRDNIKLSREEYRQLRRYDRVSDVEVYDSLIGGVEFNFPAKAEYKYRYEGRNYENNNRDQKIS